MGGRGGVYRCLRLRRKRCNADVVPLPNRRGVGHTHLAHHMVLLLVEGGRLLALLVLRLQDLLVLRLLALLVLRLLALLGLLQLEGGTLLILPVHLLLLLELSELLLELHH